MQNASWLITETAWTSYLWAYQLLKPATMYKQLYPKVEALIFFSRSYLQSQIC